MRLLERVGFRREGLARGLVCINGRWQDHIVFSLLAKTVHCPSLAAKSAEIPATASPAAACL
jgi:ribosomal-protein-alanine N-acetyltransferase